MAVNASNPSLNAIMKDMVNKIAFDSADDFRTFERGECVRPRGPRGASGHLAAQLWHGCSQHGDFLRGRGFWVLEGLGLRWSSCAIIVKKQE